MSTPKELIAKALSLRFRELCGERAARVAPETFGEMSAFVSRVRERLLKASPAEIKHPASETNVPAGWMVSQGDCLASLRALSTGEPSELQPVARPPLDAFLESLVASRKDPARRFSLLADRYRWPQNFSHAAEDEARELVLTELMVHDRRLLEKDSPAALASSDLWLRLNLCALHAARVPDLRFLDALNYYYELPSKERQPQTQHGWLLISYLALYARALAAWM